MEAFVSEHPEARLAEAVALFNAGEFFACHDALEEIWAETLGSQRELYQGLIHAAVALFHFEEGNLGGARKMYGSAARYLAPYTPTASGLDIARLLADLRDCFAELLQPRSGYPTGVSLPPESVPRIHPAD
jgi:predicted metal-dependent hydrolase